MHVAIVDTETTGVAQDDEAISVGILLVEIEIPSGRLIQRVGQYFGYREPQKRIHPAAARVHGLTSEMLAGKTFDTHEMQRLIARADVLIAHNAQFDARMLLPHVPIVAEKEWRCSWRQYPWAADLPNKKLDTICEYCGVERMTPHNALNDCVALAECLFPHSGKTERSRTFLGKLLSSGNYGPSLGFDTVRPVRATPAYKEPPRAPTMVSANLMRIDEEYLAAAAAEAYERDLSEGRSLAVRALGLFFVVAVLFIIFIVHKNSHV